MNNLSRNYNQRTPVAVPSMMTGAALGRRQLADKPLDHDAD